MELKTIMLVKSTSQAHVLKGNLSPLSHLYLFGPSVTLSCGHVRGLQLRVDVLDKY